MKKLFLLLFISISLSSFSQKNSDVTGEWYNAEKDAIITILRIIILCRGKSLGCLIQMMKMEIQKDPLNPNKDLRDRARLGMVMMTNFAYQKDNVWDGGTLYDPKTGKTYSGMITLKDKNILDLRGYVGIALLGRTSTWTRAK
ncbi:MAG: hypothetical protein CM15mP112_04390 [Flavobacteriales bacterium]|nr:MAG: hypothetical protein CM15mP112_04390 [Flavobacteriales bacterium]